MTNEQIEDALYDWINGILGFQTIFADPNIDRPTTSYVLVKILTDVTMGTKETVGLKLPNESTDNTYSTLNEISISINTYYAGAFQLAKDVKNSLMTLEVSEHLWDSGLGFVSSTQIQPIEELINDRWEDRAQFDMVFTVRETTTENIATIKKTEITNELDGTTTTIGEN